MASMQRSWQSLRSLCYYYYYYYYYYYCCCCLVQWKDDLYWVKLHSILFFFLAIYRGIPVSQCSEYGLLSPSIVAKLLGKPDDRVGRCEWERVGCVWRHRYLQQLASLLRAVSVRIRHDTIGSMFVHRTIVTSLFVRYSVAATPAGRLRHENVTRWHESGEGSDWERRTFQSLSYIPYSYFSAAQGPEYRWEEVEQDTGHPPSS